MELEPREALAQRNRHLEAYRLHCLGWSYQRIAGKLTKADGTHPSKVHARKWALRGESIINIGKAA